MRRRDPAVAPLPIPVAAPVTAPGTNPPTTLSRPRRLALYGGSFDPVHRGHLFVARRAREAFSLDRVVLVPAARPPHKPGVRLAPGRDRLEMVRRTAAHEPWLDASGLELERPGPSYTYDTLVELPEAVGEDPDTVERWFLIGSDNLPGLPGWYRARELLELARPVVVWRGEEDPSIVGDEVREALGPELSARLEAGFLRVPPHPGSATRLREALRAGETDHPDLLPEVADHIRARDLYRER